MDKKKIIPIAIVMVVFVIFSINTFYDLRLFSIFSGIESEVQLDRCQYSNNKLKAWYPHVDQGVSHYDKQVYAPDVSGSSHCLEHVDITDVYDQNKPVTCKVHLGTVKDTRNEIIKDIDYTFEGVPLVGSTPEGVEHSGWEGWYSESDCADGQCDYDYDMGCMLNYTQYKPILDEFHYENMVDPVMSQLKILEDTGKDSTYVTFDFSPAVSTTSTTSTTTSTTTTTIQQKPQGTIGISFISVLSLLSIIGLALIFVM